MKEIFKEISPDGQYGLAIIADSEVKLPAMGSIELIGIDSGVKTFKFYPDSRRPWIYVGNDVESISGAIISERARLSPSVVATIVAGTDSFVIRDESGLRAFHHGVEVDVPERVIKLHEELENSF